MISLLMLSHDDDDDAAGTDGRMGRGRFSFTSLNWAAVAISVVSFDGGAADRHIQRPPSLCTRTNLARINTAKVRAVPERDGRSPLFTVPSHPRPLL